MKIALIGYGRMGRAIEEIALKKGHEITLRISSSNTEELNPVNLAKADVAIEFTQPHSAFRNVETCLLAGLPVVCGSTGWGEQLEEARQICRERDGSFLYASNFSIGVNIFFELNSRLAALMAHRPEYDVSIHEVHHTGKKDAPSGTAITLAEQVIEKIARKRRWVNGRNEEADELSITSERTDPAPGTHHVTYNSAIDDIEIIHTAHSREGFAMGALMAAEYIHGKKGCFTMKDVLEI